MIYPWPKILIGTLPLLDPGLMSWATGRHSNWSLTHNFYQHTLGITAPEQLELAHEMTSVGFLSIPPHLSRWPVWCIPTWTPIVTIYREKFSMAIFRADQNELHSLYCRMCIFEKDMCPTTTSRNDLFFSSI